MHLPNRGSLENALLKSWQQDFPGIQSWVLHYLDGTLTIDIFCDLKFDRWQPLSDRIQADVHQEPQITKIQLYAQHQVIIGSTTPVI